MAMLTLEEVKAYLHVDYDDEDNLINLLMSAADLFLKGKIGKSYPVDDERAKTLSLIIISDLFDNRQMNEKISGSPKYTSEKVSGVTRKLVEDFALQLKLELRS